MLHVVEPDGGSPASEQCRRNHVGTPARGCDAGSRSGHRCPVFRPAVSRRMAWGRDPVVDVRFPAPRAGAPEVGGAGTSSVARAPSWGQVLPRCASNDRRRGLRRPRNCGAGGCGGRATAAPGAAGGAQLRRPRNCGGRGMPAAGKPGAVALRRPRGATRKARRHPARHPRGSWTLPRKRMVPVWRSLTVNAKGRSTSNGGGPADSSMTPPVTAAASVPSSSTRM